MNPNDSYGRYQRPTRNQFFIDWLNHTIPPCEIIELGLSTKSCVSRSDDKKDWCDVCRSEDL